MRKLYIQYTLLCFIVFISVPLFAQVQANFTAVATSGCSPLTVQFKDFSSGSPTQWYWDFGNGLTSTLQNPSVTYTVPGSYTIRLIVSNASGRDYRVKSNYITVFEVPVAAFTANIDSGCLPLPVSFTDASTSANAIKSWSWNFGDGTTSSAQNPKHTFSANAKFNVTLAVQTQQGCMADTSGNFAAGSQPVADFSAAPLDGCASLFRKFTNKTSEVFTSSSWDFMDGTTSIQKDPRHHFMDTGLFSVKLVVRQNGCADSVEKLNYVHVIGPVAIIHKRVDCINRLNVLYNNSSIAGKSFHWNFSDGTTSDSNRFTHTFPGAGTYYIKLFVTGTTCSDTAYDSIFISNKKPFILNEPQKSIFCRNDSVQFILSGYDTVFTRYFAWNFGDGTVAALSGRNDSVYHQYSFNGTYKPVAYIRDIYNCNDTIKTDNTVTINSPFARFREILPGCTNDTVFFKDSSAGVNGTAVNFWQWDYDDGTIDTTVAPFSHVFNFPGTYNVQLMVKDQSGCTDTVSHDILITNNPLVDAGTDSFLCAGKTITLQPSGGRTYTWQTSADLSCINCINPVASPAKTKTYYVTGYNFYGCSAADSVKITVQQKEKLAVNSNAFTVCAGTSLQFNASGTDVYKWFPAAGLNNSNIANPVATPLVTTAYTVKGSDVKACFTDTALINVTVFPKPSISFTDSIVDIIPGNAFNIIPVASADIQTYQWLPASGLSCFTCPQPVANISQRITYTVSVANAAGCTNEATITFIPLCLDSKIFIPNTFSPNNDGINDYFYPRANGELLIKSFLIFNRWGQVVFRKQNFFANSETDGWNGKYNNIPQKSDAYVYVMQLQCTGDQPFVAKGSLTLIR